MTISNSEYRGKVQWLSENSEPRWRVKAIEREVRAYEREHGVPEAPVATGTWWVLFFPDRPGQPTGSKVRHFDRHCHILADHPDEEIRVAVPEELRELPPCQICAE